MGINSEFDVPALYGFCGFIGSGKNTAASFLLNHTQGQAQSFAGPLKDGVAAIFGWPREMLEGQTEASRAWREQPDEFWSRVYNRTVTPRLVLQEVGTNVFRQYLPNIWIEASARRVQSDTTTVFTDMRFGNEKEWVTCHDGTLIWVYRPEMPHLSADMSRMVRQLVDQHDTLSDEHIRIVIQEVCRFDSTHASETSFLSDGVYFPHVVIKNTSTLDDLSLMTQHIHRQKTIKLPFGEMMPWGKRTLYLSMLNGDYWWEWVTARGEDRYCVYNNDHKLVSALTREHNGDT